MYINPFVFGVLATVGAEILAIVVYCFYCYFESKTIQRMKDRRKNENNLQKEESEPNDER